MPFEYIHEQLPDCYALAGPDAQELKDAIIEKVYVPRNYKAKELQRYSTAELFLNAFAQSGWHLPQWSGNQQSGYYFAKLTPGDIPPELQHSPESVISALDTLLNNRKRSRAGDITLERTLVDDVLELMATKQKIFLSVGRDVMPAPKDPKSQRFTADYYAQHSAMFKTMLAESMGVSVRNLESLVPDNKQKSFLSIIQKLIRLAEREIKSHRPSDNPDEERILWEAKTPMQLIERYLAGASLEDRNAEAIKDKAKHEMPGLDVLADKLRDVMSSPGVMSSSTNTSHRLKLHEIQVTGYAMAAYLPELMARLTSGKVEKPERHFAAKPQSNLDTLVHWANDGLEVTLSGVCVPATQPVDGEQSARRIPITSTLSVRVLDDTLEREVTLKDDFDSKAFIEAIKKIQKTGIDGLHVQFVMDLIDSDKDIAKQIHIPGGLEFYHH